MKYTVIGVYRNDFSRFSYCADTEDPQLAEFEAVEALKEDVVIAGVIEGWHLRVDQDTNEGRDDDRYCYRCGKPAGSRPNPHHSQDCSLFDDH